MLTTTLALCQVAAPMAVQEELAITKQHRILQDRSNTTNTSDKNMAKNPGQHFTRTKNTPTDTLEKPWIVLEQYIYEPDDFLPPKNSESRIKKLTG